MVNRYFNTLRHLTLRQISARLRFHICKPAPDFSPPPPRREIAGKWVPPICGKEALRGRWRFEFLNDARDLILPGDWNPTGVSRLWVYNLHYFDDLKSCNAADRSDLHRELIVKWIEENPPSSGTGWDPYPTSLRIVNWIKWVMAGNDLPAAATHSLAVQARWLLKRIEYHLLGNHLLTNAKALIFAGTFFDGPEAKTWRDAGQRILRNQLPEQVLADGGHYERSPMYHLLVLEDLLDIVNLCNAYKRQVPLLWREVIGRMLVWSCLMRHPDGEIPFFNDASTGVAPSPEQIDRYAEVLGFEPVKPVKSVCLPDSGYCRAEKGDAILFVDCGPVGPDYQPGHAHADTLSFEVSVKGKRVFVNSGTSTYERGKERTRQRGSAAHNTIVIDGLDSSEVWAAFRVARRARTEILESDLEGLRFVISAQHDGYKRLSGNVMHCRTWRLTDSGLEIGDRVSGRGRHRLEMFFHLHPGVDMHEYCGNIHMSWSDSGQKIAILHPDSGVHVSIENSTYHPAFGRTIPNRRIACRVETELPCKLTTNIEWVKN